MSSTTTITSAPPPTVDDELDSTIILAIVIGSTGFVLMMLGAVYYLTRLGDVPSRKRAVANAPPAMTAHQEEKDLEHGGYVLGCGQRGVWQSCFYVSPCRLTILSF